MQISIFQMQPENKCKARNKSIHSNGFTERKIQEEIKTKEETSSSTKLGNLLCFMVGEGGVFALWNCIKYDVHINLTKVDATLVRLTTKCANWLWKKFVIKLKKLLVSSWHTEQDCSRTFFVNTSTCKYVSMQNVSAAEAEAKALICRSSFRECAR